MNIKKYMRMRLLKNKKILILGSSGLIGSNLSKYLNSKNLNLNLSVSSKTSIEATHVLKKIGSIVVFDVLNIDNIDNYITKINPDIIINCLGITKHLIYKHSKKDIFFINSILPNLISNWCCINDRKFIHISSDCVFNKTELGLKTIAQDLYGNSKFLGEHNLFNGTIIRTSTIGHEINTKYGLLEWFLNEPSETKGFTEAFFNGVTTLTLSRYIYKMLNDVSSDKKIINLTSERISKYDLLSLINKIYDTKKTLLKVSFPKIDRSLDKTENEELIFIKQNWYNQILDTKIFEINN